MKLNVSCLALLICPVLVFQVGTALSANGANGFVSSQELGGIFERIVIHENGVAECTVRAKVQSAGQAVVIPTSYLWVERLTARLSLPPRQGSGSGSATGMSSGPASRGDLDALVSFEANEAETHFLVSHPMGQDLSGTTVELSFRDPAHLVWRLSGPGRHGLYSHAHSFINTTGGVVASYTMEMILPGGFLIHRIVKSDPPASPKKPQPPYRLFDSGGCHGVKIISGRLAAGGRCGMTIEIKRAEVPSILLAISLGIAIVFMFLFRDMVFPGASKARGEGPGPPDDDSGRRLSSWFFTPLLLTLSCLTLQSCGPPGTPVTSLKPVAVFGSRGLAPGKFADIDGVAYLADGTIAVGDARKVQFFSPEGKFLRHIGGSGNGPGKFRTEAAGVAIDSKGRIIVTDPGNFRVQVFSPSGEYVFSIGGRGDEDGRFLKPEGVCAAPGDVIVVSDGTRCRIQMFSADGKLTRAFGKPGNGPGELLEPEAMAIHDGKIFISDEGNSRIQIFSLEGIHAGFIGKGVPLFNPMGTEDGPDAYAGAKANTPNGNGTEDAWAAGSTSAPTLHTREFEGLAFGLSGVLFAANEDERVIEAFGDGGRHIGRFSSGAMGGFGRIQGLCISRDGRRMAVADLGGSCVQVFSMADIAEALGIKYP